MKLNRFCFALLLITGNLLTLLAASVTASDEKGAEDEEPSIPGSGELTENREFGAANASTLLELYDNPGGAKLLERIASGEAENIKTQADLEKRRLELQHKELLCRAEQNIRQATLAQATLDASREEGERTCKSNLEMEELKYKNRRMILACQAQALFAVLAAVTVWISVLTYRFS